MIGSLARVFVAMAIRLAPVFILLYFFAPHRLTLLVAATYGLYGLGNLLPRWNGLLLFLSLAPCVAIFKTCGYWLYDGTLSEWSNVPRHIGSWIGGLGLGLVAMLIGSTVAWYFFQAFVRTYNEFVRIENNRKLSLR